MIFEPLSIAGSWLIRLEPIEDDRGLFARAFDERAFRERGLALPAVQVNLSVSRRRGTIRGLHWQVEPYGEAKFLRCTRGAVYDVAVDLRADSPSCRQWQGVRLSADDRAAVYVPAGCAHGYQALEDGAEVLYGVSQPYVPGAERGLRWDDPALRIEWPIRDGVIVSDKDAAWPTLDEVPVT